MNDQPAPNWKLRNRILGLALIAYFILVSYVAHNRMLFGTWLPFTRADLVPLVQDRLAPVVRAMKEYQSIHGTLPDDQRDLTPWFPEDSSHRLNQGLWEVSINKGEFYYRYQYEKVIYHFPPGAEGWEIRGTVLNGQIPAPIVNVAPATSPTTSP